jgi:hypothetical protein
MTPPAIEEIRRTAALLNLTVYKSADLELVDSQTNFEADAKRIRLTGGDPPFYIEVKCDDDWVPTAAALYVNYADKAVGRKLVSMIGAPIGAGEITMLYGTAPDKKKKRDMAIAHHAYFSKKTRWR